jgi:hypothetical protein
MNPQTLTTTANQPTRQHRSTAAVVIGVILVILSLVGLWIGVSLTQPSGFINFSNVGHFFVALSILIGGGGIWLVAIGSRPTESATPGRSPISNALPPDRCAAPHVGAAPQPADVG